jgi:hypothetical protein
MSDAQKVLVKLTIFEDPQVVGRDELSALAREGILAEVIGEAKNDAPEAYDPDKKLLSQIPGIEKVRPDLVEKKSAAAADDKPKGAK